MGIYDMLKKKGKQFVANQQEVGRRNAQLKKERKDFNKEVKQAVLEERRKYFKKEALVQAKVIGKMDAQRSFKTPQQRANGGMSADAKAIIYGSGGFGSPTPAQQQVVKKIRQQRSPAKKSKKRTKRVVRKVEQKVVDPVADLLSRLPQ